MKKKVWIGIGIISLISLMIGVSVYRQAFAKGPAVETARAMNEEISSVLMIPGTLKLQEEQIVYPSPEKGELKEILVTEGQTVTKGTVLARFENPQLNLELEQNKLAVESGNLKISQLDQQLKQLEEKKDELGKQAGKKEAEKQMKPEIEQATLEKRMATIDLKQTLLQKDMTEQKIKDLEITSSIDGTVLTINKQTSPQTEGAGTEPIIQIGSLEGMIVSGLLSEYDTLKIQPGQKVTLRSDAVPDQEWQGDIASIGTLPQENAAGMQNDTQAVQYPVTVKFTSNNLKLKPGFQLIMDIETEKKKALTVPVNAIIEEGEKQFVYILDKNTAQKQKIRTGISSGEKIEVRDGLTEKDRIIINPPDNLKDGMEVTKK